MAAWFVIQRPDSANGSRLAFEDLGARVGSALVLAPAALIASIAGGAWAAGAAGAAATAMSYEWARMSAPDAMRLPLALTLLGALGAIMLTSWHLPLWAMAWLGLWAMIAGLRARFWVRALEAAGGVVYVGLPCIAFLWLRADGAWGWRAIASLLVIIWSADSAAYFSGRVFGGPKLLPSASPHKTWAGAAAAVLAGAAAGAACAQLFDAAIWLWLGGGAGLAAIGLGGDLFESALKRRFGVKDASRLIPGHGGVLDRVDGLMAAVCVMALGCALFPQGAKYFFGILAS